jgi:hypothetical protein
MDNAKVYSAMSVSILGNVTEITQLGVGKSGAVTDGMNQVGNMMDMM